MSPLQTVSDVLVPAREWLTAMAQLGTVKAEQDALKAKQETSQKTLSVAAEVLRNAIEGLWRQQHRLAGRYNQIARLLSSTVPAPVDCRVVQGPSGTDESHPTPFKRPR